MLNQVFEIRRSKLKKLAASLLITLASGGARAEAAHHSSYEQTHALGSRPSATATSGNLGLGLMLGEPTGFSAKYWLSRKNALAFGLTYSFSRSMGLLADYLWEFSDAFGAKGAEFVPFVGGGLVAFVGGSSYDSRGRLIDNGRDVFDLGIRVPFGVEYLPRHAPIGIVAELAPGIGIAPSTFGFFQGDLGIRYYL